MHIPDNLMPFSGDHLAIMDVEGTSLPDTAHYKAPFKTNMEKPRERTQESEATYKRIKLRHTIKMAKESASTMSPSTSAGTMPRGLSFKNSTFQLYAEKLLKEKCTGVCDWHPKALTCPYESISYS